MLMLAFFPQVSSLVFLVVFWLPMAVSVDQAVVAMGLTLAAVVARVVGLARGRGA